MHQQFFVNSTRARANNVDKEFIAFYFRHISHLQPLMPFQCTPTQFCIVDYVHDSGLPHTPHNHLNITSFKYIYSFHFYKKKVVFNSFQLRRN